MPIVEVEITDDSLNEVIVKDLKTQHEMYWDNIDSTRSKKLRKAFKRVIEYYGGKLDE